MRKTTDPIVLTHNTTKKEHVFYPMVIVDAFGPEIEKISEIRDACMAACLKKTHMYPKPMYMDGNGDTYMNDDNLDIHKIKKAIGKYSLVFCFPKGCVKHVNDIVRTYNLKKFAGPFCGSITYDEMVASYNRAGRPYGLDGKGIWITQQGYKFVKTK